jgi:competence ComEA-like helix-hairpin-helix protein
VQPKAAPSQFAAALIACALALVALARTGERAPHVALQRPASRPVSVAAVRALRAGEPLELNTAAVGDLQLLPGVGPKLAQRIVDERERRGGFHNIEQLSEVKGVGPQTLAHIRSLVRVTLRDPRATSR